MSLCAHVHTHVSLCTCMSMHVSICTCMRTCEHVRPCVSTCTCEHVHMCVRVFVCARACTWVCNPTLVFSLSVLKGTSAPLCTAGLAGAPVRPHATTPLTPRVTGPTVTPMHVLMAQLILELAPWVIQWATLPHSHPTIQPFPQPSISRCPGSVV